MLVLNGRKGDKFVIADGEVTVQITSIKGGQVKLGFIADRDIRIDREVTHRKRKAEEAQMAQEVKA